MAEDEIQEEVSVEPVEAPQASSDDSIVEQLRLQNQQLSQLMQQQNAAPASIPLQELPELPDPYEDREGFRRVMVEREKVLADNAAAAMRAEMQRETARIRAENDQRDMMNKFKEQNPLYDDDVFIEAAWKKAYPNGSSNDDRETMLRRTKDAADEMANKFRGTPAGRTAGLGGGSNSSVPARKSPGSSPASGSNEKPKSFSDEMRAFQDDMPSFGGRGRSAN